MTVTIEFSQLQAEARRAATLTPQARQRSWQVVRVVSFNAERNVKLQMPVDTGRARASWGHSSAPALPGDGIWDEDEQGLSITQGSTVEYIPALNEGSSSQAPAGFIDSIERRSAQELEQMLANELAKIL